MFYSKRFYSKRFCSKRNPPAGAGALGRPVVLALMTAALVVAAPALAKKYPDVSDDGLQRVDHKSLDAVYWAEGATLAGYEQVLIDDVEVSFRKNWQRDQNSSRRGANARITAEDMTSIRTAVAEGFTEVFIEELTEAGYEVVETPGENVLALRPSIVDLDVAAPDLTQRQPGRTLTYTTSAGRMTLDLELLDSGSNSLIGRVYDQRRARDTGMLQFSNSITNRQEARIMFRAWAKALVKALDEAEAPS